MIVHYKKWLKIGIICEVLLLALGGIWIGNQKLQQVNSNTAKKDFIKWVDFNVTLSALEKAYTYDVESYKEKVPLDWITLLAYTATKTGGDFSNSKTVSKEMENAVEQIKSGKGSNELFKKEYKNYSYFYESYSAVLGGLVGNYQLEETTLEEKQNQMVSGSAVDTKDKKKESSKKWTKQYGLKGFSPLAKGFDYSDYDDFGVSRSYGYKRRHLGHDMMGQIGTPVIAVESGTVEAMGWNQYGGWRVGIRSFDKKRYYYYAHLRQNVPFGNGLEEGSVVTAGDVIGYLGHTGYSKNENVNNIDTPHLHFGLQLIFDESQKEGNNEIWVDCYALVQFLRRNRSETMKVEGTKHWTRVREMKE